MLAIRPGKDNIQRQNNQYNQIDDILSAYDINQRVLDR